MEEKKRVLLVNQYFYPSDAATAVLLRELVEDLAVQFDITVLCESAKGEAAEAQGYRVERRSLPSWIPERRAVASPILRWVSSFLFIVRVIGYLLVTRRFDLVILASEPPFVDMLAGLVCIVQRQPYLIIVQDLYPEFAKAVRLRPVAWFSWPLKRLHSFVARRARNVIAISQDHIDTLAQRGVPVEVLIPNWAPSRVVSGEPRPMPNDDGKILVHYAGNLGLACDLDALEVALESLEAQGELQNFQIVLRGDGIKRNQAERIANRYQQVSYQHRVAVEEVAEALGECHAHLILMPARLQGCVYPSKANTIMASGRPMIASIPSESTLATFIAAQRVGYVSPAEDPSQLASCMMKCFRDLRENPRALSEMGARGWRYATHEWNRAQAMTRYCAVVKDALDAR